MRRTSWKAALVVLLAWTGLAWGQGTANQGARYLLVGDPPQKCRLLASWRMEDGRRAYDVQALGSGEVLTLYEMAPSKQQGSGGLLSGLRMRIAHWGNSRTRPAGFPAPPTGCAGKCTACNGSAKSSDLSFGTPMTSESGSSSPYGAAPAQPRTISGSGSPYAAATVRPRIVSQVVAHSDSPYGAAIVQPRIAPQVVAQGPSCCCSCQPTFVSSNPCGCSASGNTMMAAAPITPVPMETISQGEPMTGSPVLNEMPVSAEPPVVKRVTRPSKAPVLSELASQSRPKVAPTPVPPAPSTPPSVQGSAVSARGSWTTQWSGANQTTAAPTAPPTVPDLPPAPVSAPDAGPASVSVPAVPPAAQPSSPPFAVSVPTERNSSSASAKPKPPTKLGQSSAKSAYAPGVMPPAFPVGSSGPAPTLPNSRTDRPGVSDPLSARYFLPPSAEKQLTARNDSAATALAPVASTAAKKETASTLPARLPANPTPITAKPGDPLGGRMPLGAASVLAAYDDKPGGIRYIPVPIVTMPQPNTPPKPPEAPAVKLPKAPDPFANAFSPAGGASGQAQSAWRNAFSPRPSDKADQPTPGSPMPIAQYPMAPSMMASPPAYAMERYPYPGMMPAAAPAAVRPTTLPASYTSPTVAAAPAEPVYANPAMDRPGMPVALPTRTVNAEAVQKMTGILKNSLYPSQREWSAEYLASLDWHTHEQVLPALLTAAREDPAATVRLSCVRCLARMNVNADLMRGTLEALHSDPDAGVRTAADQALAQFSPDAPTAIQPASAVNP
jgi:hypothetical protein